MRRARVLICGACVVLAGALSACGSTDDTLNFGKWTDCATIGKPVVISDPAGDQRHSDGIKDTSAPKGDLRQLRVAKNDNQLCAEFTVGQPVRPFVAYVLSMRPQATATPVVQLEATVLAGQAPNAELDLQGNGQHFRKVAATVEIKGDSLSIVVDKAPFAKAGFSALFRSFRFQARSAVVTKNEGRLTDCMSVCE